MVRIYNKWAGNPEGTKENLDHCIVECFNGWFFHQCSRARGFGKDKLFCKQHAKIYPTGTGLYIPEDKEREN